MTDNAAALPPAANLSWYRRLYLRVEALSRTPHALVAYLLVAVADASVFPVPPFALLVPMVLAEPRKWLRLAILGTIASLLGGLIGYYIGMELSDFAVNTLHIDMNLPIRRFGIDSTVGQLLGDQFWILALLCSVLPSPFKVVAIGSGLVKVPIAKFMLAAVIGRSVRFLVVAGVMRFVGPTARRWLRV